MFNIQQLKVLLVPVLDRCLNQQYVCLYFVLHPDVCVCAWLPVQEARAYWTPLWCHVTSSSCPRSCHPHSMMASKGLQPGKHMYTCTYTCYSCGIGQAHAFCVPSSINYQYSACANFFANIHLCALGPMHTWSTLCMFFASCPQRPGLTPSHSTLPAPVLRPARARACRPRTRSEWLSATGLRQARRSR